MTEEMRAASHMHKVIQRRQNKLIGKMVTIKDGIYKGERGIVKDYDGVFYYIAIATGTGSLPIFTRDEFRVPKH